MVTALWEFNSVSLLFVGPRFLSSGKVNLKYICHDLSFTNNIIKINSLLNWTTKKEGGRILRRHKNRTNYNSIILIL